jgi:two-component system, sensor histidine kinase
LSKKLAQALGGDLLLLESKVDQGTTFGFKFNPGKLVAAEMAPHKTEASSAKIKVAKFSDEIKDMKILLVEDSLDNQNLFSRYLKQAGGIVDIANDGVEGVTFARNKIYDVILMDVQMPNLDGYGATELLRAEGFTLPIIALTAHAMREDREKALSKGFTDYLTKPFQAATLIQTLVTLRQPAHV